MRKPRFVVPAPDRRLAVDVAAGLALFAAGCGASNNKGRIEGKWKVVSVGEGLDAERLRDAVLVFGDDGTVTLEDPARPKPAPDAEGPKPPGWRYKLLAGDAADFYDLPPDATERLGLFPTDTRRVRVTARIEVATGGKYEARVMTLTDARGQTLKLVLTR